MVAVLTFFSTRRVLVRSDDMVPTLERGEWVAIQSYGRKEPRIGDVIAYFHPKDSLEIWDNPRLAIHRVVAMGNDLPILPDGSSGPRVPEGHVYVLGDSPNSKRDSRLFGPLKIVDVRGRVTSVVHPRERKRKVVRSNKSSDRGESPTEIKP